MSRASSFPFAPLLSYSRPLVCGRYFSTCVSFSALSEFYFFYDKNTNHNNGTKVELVYAKNKIQRFYASKNSSLGLFMFSLLELASQCCFLPLPLRFHHSADYCHQRKANRLHPDVRIQSSRCRVDIWQKILTRVTPNQRRKSKAMSLFLPQRIGRSKNMTRVAVGLVMLDMHLMTIQAISKSQRIV